MQEFRAAYPHRWLVPAETWRGFFARAENEIGVLAYSGLFLAEDAAILRIFRDKARAGAKVRLLLGARAANTSTLGEARKASERLWQRAFGTPPFSCARWCPCPESRSGCTTTPYNSIFRADDELLINTHVYGQPATHSPVLHLRGMGEAAMVSTYLESFERVWVVGQCVTARHG